MNRRCGSSKPTPTPLNGLATYEARKNAKKVIEVNADTIRRQTIRQNLPRTGSVAGGRDDKALWQDQPPPKPARVSSAWRGGETKKGELKEKTGAKTRETNIKTLPQTTIVAGGRDQKAKAKNEMEKRRNPQSRAGGEVPS